MPKQPVPYDTMGSKHKPREESVLMRRIAVYLAGFLGGLLIYTVLKVWTNGSIVPAELKTHGPQMTILPEMQPDDMSFYQDNDKLGAGMMFLCVSTPGDQMWWTTPPSDTPV